MFCSHCGAAMVETKVPAEELTVWCFDDTTHPYTPFNKETGERQFVPKFRCPNSTKYFNKHDEYLVDRLI